MKKVVSMLLIGMLIVSILVSPASAAQISIYDDFIGYVDGDVGTIGLTRTFKSLESSDHARIKYAFGKGFLCPDGGGAVASIVYKIPLSSGEKISSLDLEVKAHFNSRTDYDPAWTVAPKGVVSVSSNKEVYTVVTTWEGALLSKDLGQNDYKDIEPNTYNVNLSSAVKDFTDVYVKIEWDVYDYPLYSSIHTVEFTGSTKSGGDTSLVSSSAPQSSLVSSSQASISTSESSAIVSTGKSTVVSAGTSSEIQLSSQMISEEGISAESSEDMSNGDVISESDGSEASVISEEPDNTDPDKNVNAPIVWIIIGIVVVIVAATGGILFMLKKKKQ